MSPEKGSDHSRGQRELTETPVSPEAPASWLTQMGDGLWPVSRLIIPAMPPLASYVRREVGVLSEIGRRLVDWASLLNGLFILSPINRLGHLDRSWPLLDLIWFGPHWRQEDEFLEIEPTLDPGLPISLDPFTIAPGGLLKSVFPFPEIGSSWADQTDFVLPRMNAEGTVRGIIQNHPTVLKNARLRMALPVVRQSQLITRNPGLTIGRERQRQIIPSHPIYPAYCTLVHLPVLTEVTEPTEEALGWSLPSLTKQRQILPIYWTQERRRPGLKPAESGRYNSAEIGWQAETTYPGQSLESVWPPFTQVLMAPGLPVVKPIYFVRRQIPLARITPVTSESLVLSQAASPETPRLANAQLVLPRGVSNREIVLPTREAPLETSSKNYLIEAIPNLPYAPYDIVSNIVKTAASSEIPLISRPISRPPKPELSLLKPSGAISQKPLEPTAQMVTPAQVVKSRESPISMPLVTPLPPAPVEPPAVQMTAERRETPIPGQKVPAPPAPGKLGRREIYQSESGPASLLFKEAMSLSGFGYEVSEVIGQAPEGSAQHTSPPEAGVEEGFSSHQPGKPLVGTQKTQRAEVKPPVPPVTKTQPGFSSIYRAGFLSVFEGQSPPESQLSSTAELALAPVGRRAEAAEAPQRWKESRTEEQTQATPGPDLEALANDVYRILKWRLACERERALGVS